MKTITNCKTLLTALICFIVSFSYGQTAEYAPGQILIKLKSGKSIAQKNALKSSMQANSLKTYPQLNIELWEVGTNSGTVDIKALVSQYRNHPDVEFVEPNYIYSIGTTVPDDPGFGNLWGMNNVGQSGGTQDADIDAPEAWDIATESPSIVVAIIDTGIDWGHEDLIDNIWQNLGEDADGDGQVLVWDGSDWIFDPGDENGIDDDGNGYADDFVGWDFRNEDNNPYDGHSHGTHVAGTVGAKGDNGKGVAGVTWDVQLAALKFLSDSGWGSTSDAIEALRYAVDMGIPISNNSWGGGSYSTALYQVLQNAETNGHLFVAAAGNRNNDNDSNPYYPNTYDTDNIISVASTTRNDGRSSFSSYGATTVDLGAPGSQIYSCEPNNTYDYKSGTSMAAPHVAGACALLWGLCPTKTYDQIKADIMNSSDPISALAGITVSGGRLNLYNALLTCNTQPPSTCRQNDSLALVALYNSTNGSSWTNPWNLSQSMDNWTGVTLSTGGCVQVLNLPTNGMAGSIPTDIGSLQDMVYLNLSGNQLSGNIPNTIGNLQNLGFLNLQNNQLSGDIPVEITNLQGVSFLALDNNQLSGSILLEFANMQSLGLLYLNDNQLSGCYAPDLAGLCTQLVVSGNANISNGNNFNAAWEDFCSTEAGACNGDVWPGDADANGLVNADDYLFWGRGFALGATGSSRLDASPDWTGQPSPEWSQDIDGINCKHQDCDGNGMIDGQDDNIIAANWNLTNSSSTALNSYTASTLNYRLEPLPPINGYLRYALYVEDNQGDWIEAHGLSFTLNLSNDIPVTNITLDETASSLNPDETFSHYDNAENKLTVALTRTDGVNKLCDDFIAVFSVVSNDLPDGEPFSIDVENGSRLVSNGTLDNVSGMSIFDVYTGALPDSDNLILTAAATHAQCNDLGSASVSLFGGATPYTYLWNTGATTSEITDLTPGAYSVTVTDASGLSQIITAEVEGLYIPIYDEMGNLIDCSNSTTCPTLIEPNSTIPTGSYQAGTAVNSVGTVSNGSDVEFKAEEIIILNPGFSVEPNAEFSADIEECDGN